MGFFSKRSKQPEVIPEVDMDDHIFIDDVILPQESSISEAIMNHLKMKTSGALLLTGDWGAGKTYHIKNTVFPIISQKTSFTPIMVSLYGVTNINTVAQKVLFAYLDDKGKNIKLSTGAITKNLKHLIEAVPILKNYVDIEKVLVGSGDNIFSFLPNKELVLFFDDIERMGKNITTDDFLGIINNLIENRGIKVILIANEEKIEGGINYKEKTIEKTLHYSPDISEVYDSIVNSYDDGDFKSYLRENKAEILKPLNFIVDETENEELRKSFSNIRTLKFAIEHFKYSFEIVNRTNRTELISTELKNLWYFTLAVSTEFRKPNNITFKDRKGIDNLFNLFIDIDELINSNSRVSDISTPDFSDEFKNLYFNRHNEPYHFYEEVYNLITAGKLIQSEKLLENLETSFKVVEGEIEPSQRLLNRFMHGYYKFSNEEISNALNDLFDFVKNGEFSDLISQMNAGVYLIKMKELLGKKKEEVITVLKQGADIILSKINLTYLMKSQLEMVASDFSSRELDDVVQYIQERIIVLDKQKDKEEIKKLEQDFEQNLLVLIQKFKGNQEGIRNPDKPVFHFFDKEIVKKSIKNWSPEELMMLSELLKYRYLKTGFPNYLVEELLFLENLHEGISEIDLQEIKLSNKIIKEQLIPSIEKSVERLEYENRE
ncbi:P-loop NTPase fold protein [Aequorivita viscosa]|uniref:KAP family P-loop domain-containing protein n=1 Tax=Aequorivita viscosa TaxID=797419 RepID=A0A1M6MIF5_9FLAO|nr:P-loop NTPase fold protein [Aequorivita viscosa]SDX34212.1 KAP family P-loop domain-containing protein [Aequorivita viscosa]SHJ83255.1 KAP family P-loop domain-containing protein [Aequorivita viscosa]